MSTSLVVPSQPTSLVAVDDTCAAIEAWAEECDSIPELKDAANKLAAIDEYLDLTTTEGRGRVAAAMRRLEVRIGRLLGPPPPPQETGARKGSSADEPSGLTPNQRSDFRKLAENEDVVEGVIAESTDQQPASRNKVKAAIREQQEPKEPNGHLKMSDARWLRVKNLAAQGATSRQLADEYEVGLSHFRKAAERRGITFPADEVVGTTRRIDPARVVAAIVHDVASTADSIGTVPIAWAALDPDQVAGWVSSLSESITTLTKFKNQLKKETQP